MLALQASGSTRSSRKACCPGSLKFYVKESIEAPNGNPKRSGLGWDSPDQPLGAPSVPPALVERRPPPPSQEGGKPSPGEGTAGSHAGVRCIGTYDSRIK